MAQQLDTPRFNMVRDWLRFTRTGDITHMLHLRDITGLQRINAELESRTHNADEFHLWAVRLGNQVNVLADLAPAIAKVSRDLVLPTIQYSLASARFDNARPELAVAGVLSRTTSFSDGSGENSRAFAEWRFFCFSSSYATYYNQIDDTSVYETFIRNGLFRSLTKECRSRNGGMLSATAAVLAELKPEVHAEYKTFIAATTQSTGRVASPWNF